MKILATSLICGLLLALCLAQTQPASKSITITLTDDQADILRIKLAEEPKLADLKTQIDQAAPPVIKPIAQLDILAKDLGKAGQENLYVAGDQVSKLQGKAILIDALQFPIIGALYEADKDRTRIIMPVGTNISNTKSTQFKVIE